MFIGLRCRFTLRNCSGGFTLVEIMIVSSIIMLLSAIGMPAVVKTRITTNETLAKETLRTISSAIAMYMSTNGNSPSAETDLLSPAANPPYLNRSYDGKTIKGYEYNYQFISGYTVTATPASCGKTGTKIFTLDHNDAISEANCI